MTIRAIPSRTKEYFRLCPPNALEGAGRGRRTADLWWHREIAAGDWSNKPVAPTRDGLDESWVLRRVAQCVSQLLERGVETFIKVDECPVGPKLFPHFLAANYFSRSLQQHGEDTEGLLLQSHPLSAPVEFTRRRVGFEQTETQAGVPIGRSPHCNNLPKTPESVPRFVQPRHAESSGAPLTSW